MTLPILSPPQPLTITLQPLTPSSFSPFGTVITSPLPASTAPTTTSTQETILTKIPTPQHQSQPTPIFANQNTALKTSPISPLINRYPPASTTKAASEPLMSLFSCFPRPTSSIENGRLRVSVLERHPYTTQTFSPLGLPADACDTAFIVIVAPTLPSPTGTPDQGPARSSGNSVQRPPDLSSIKAFIARGDQAVTYGVGTWHAPMIVLGKRTVDFVVTQFVNGTEDDCEEVGVEGVNIHLGGLPARIHVGACRRGGQEKEERGLKNRLLKKRREIEEKAKL